MILALRILSSVFSGHLYFSPGGIVFLGWTILALDIFGILVRNFGFRYGVLMEREEGFHGMGRLCLLSCCAAHSHAFTHHSVVALLYACPVSYCVQSCEVCFLLFRVLFARLTHVHQRQRSSLRGLVEAASSYTCYLRIRTIK